MPRKPIDYSECKFYRLVCKDVTVKECYVGHTTDEKSRRSNHKRACTNEKNNDHNYFVYRFIRDHGGWDNWQLIVHETTAVKDSTEAVRRERHWLEHYGATLNRNVPGQTKAEYYVAHAAEIKAYKAEYYVAHAAEGKAYSAEYRATHVDEKKAYNAEYRAAHAAELKAYLAANDDRLKEKHACECGGKYTTCGKSQHFKTAKHIAFAAK